MSNLKRVVKSYIWFWICFFLSIPLFINKWLFHKITKEENTERRKDVRSISLNFLYIKLEHLSSWCFSPNKMDNYDCSSTELLFADLQICFTTFRTENIYLMITFVDIDSWMYFSADCLSSLLLHKGMLCFFYRVFPFFSVWRRPHISRRQQNRWYLTPLK